MEKCKAVNKANKQYKIHINILSQCHLMDFHDRLCRELTIVLFFAIRIVSAFSMRYLLLKRDFELRCAGSSHKSV